MDGATQLTVCQCGHGVRFHHDELGCVLCGCRLFVLPTGNTCQTCGAEYETKEELDAHLKAYRERIFRDL